MPPKTQNSKKPKTQVNPKIEIETYEYFVPSKRLLLNRTPTL